jgi:FemAB-related protein (PEP-CTERM system-associated)
MNVRLATGTDQAAWDEYVRSFPGATLYHLFGWKRVVEKTYDHKSYYLIAAECSKGTVPNQNGLDHQTKPLVHTFQPENEKITGILPLVHLKHFLFGNSLISLPFFDMGGVLADDPGTEKALLLEAIMLAEKLGTESIELRHTQPLLCSDELESAPDEEPAATSYKLPAASWGVQTRSHKVRMLLDLPGSSDSLLKSLKSKVRSQVKKPLKEGLYARVAQLELLDDFYHVFSFNMRDLGSPVHSRELMRNVLVEFPKDSKIVVVYKGNQPLACSLVVGFKETLENPWASAIRKYSRLSPNMLLYWTMLEYACDHGYTCFDFGRSSRNGGTYKFKKQWGATPTPLYWHYMLMDGDAIDVGASEKSRFDQALRFWQKLPVSVTRILGPLIRKNIGL